MTTPDPTIQRRRQGGFTLLEATIAAVVLMVGVVALIEIHRTLLNQVSDLRQNRANPVIIEQIIHDQIQYVRSNPRSGPTLTSTIPLFLLDKATYEATVNAVAPSDWATQAYDVGVLFKTSAGTVTSPLVRISRGNYF